MGEYKYNIEYSGKFKKDLKTCQKRGYNMELIKQIINKLRIPEPLEPKNRNHGLSGNYTDYMECHILPDWLLIYRYNGDFLEVTRTGTHADLFK